MRRRLNPIFLVVLVLAVAVLGGGMHLVHGIQVRRHASAFLDRAHRAEAGDDLAGAAAALQSYLNFQTRDGPAWAWYARVREKMDPNRWALADIFYYYEQAQRFSPGDATLERKCAELALVLRRYNDAQGHVLRLIEVVPKDSQGRPAPEDLADLEDMMGQCARGLHRFDHAEQWFQQALGHDPSRVSCYDRLARMRRADLRRSDDADGAIREMVAKNPKDGRAYLYCWRYAREFWPAADANDLAFALKLAPDDPEVLATAAIARVQKNDDDAARAYYEKGHRLYPENVTFVLGLADLEARQGHLDKAEAVLRGAYQAKPTVNLAFLLADNLILQDKIDGKDQAADIINRLRNLGEMYTYTVVGFLEARILFRRKTWPEAIAKIETLRPAVQSIQELAVPLNLMLAEAYGQVGSDEQRLDALRRAAEGDRAHESASIELARALARSGRLDKAIAIISPLVDKNAELRLDLVRLLIQRAQRAPDAQQEWSNVERQMRLAESALLPRAALPLLLLNVELLAARNRLEEARTLLSAAGAKDPRNLQLRIGLAELALRAGQGPAALTILDQAETELGTSLAIQLAHLDYWGKTGGDAAKKAVAKLAASRQSIAAADQPVFLDRLATAEVRLGEPALAREYLRELTVLQPANVPVLLGRFDLALQAGDRADAMDLVAKFRAVEGERGASWRFAQAACLLDQATRDTTEKLDLEVVRRLAAEIAAQRPDWWGSDLLSGEVSELQGRTEEAIKHYTRAVERGNVRLPLARRLVGLLNQSNQFDQIEHVVKLLTDRGIAPGELVITTALNAIRQKDYDRGIALARQVFSETSTNFAEHLFMGQFYQAAQRPREAGQALRRAVELGPGVPMAWLSYVRYLVQEKQVVEARAAVAAARRALPMDRAGLALAQCHILVGDTTQADTMIQAALDSPTCDLGTIQAAVDLYANQGRYDRVNPILDKLRAPAMKATPEVLAWANRTRARASLSTGRSADIDQALGLLDQNLKSDPSNQDDLKLKAFLLATRTNSRGEAINLLEPLEAANQLGTADQFVLAQVHLAERLGDKYRAQMLKILGSGARDPRHLVHFVDFLIGRGELDQADRWLAELKKVAPPSLSLALLEREARLLQARKRDGELLALLQARGKQVPDEIGVVAGLLDRFGFAREAEASYKAFIARKPDQPERALALASFLARHDRTQEAVAILDFAWKTCRPELVAATSLPLYLAPSADAKLRRQVETWLTEAIGKSPAAAASLRPELATIYCMQKRYDDAELLLREILRSDPDQVKALNTLAWLLALRDGGKSGEALELINRAIDVEGATSSLVDTRAVALIRAGQLDQATHELRDAQAVDPKNVSLALHLAWAYQEAGNTDLARKAFQQAQELGLKLETRDPLERSMIDGLCRQLVTDQSSPASRG